MKEKKKEKSNFNRVDTDAFYKSKMWREVREEMDWIADSCKTTTAKINLRVKKKYRREE